MTAQLRELKADLAAAFRWAARLNLHEGVANHFSLAINDSGTRFLMNPNQRHFARIRASDLIEIDANDPETLAGPDAPILRRGVCTVVFIGTAPMHGALCMCIQITRRFLHRLQTVTCRRLTRTRRCFSTVMSLTTPIWPCSRG